MTNHNTMKNPDLPGGDFFWKGDQTGVLLIHGFTATTAEVRPMAGMLHQAGFTVAGPLLPGHGTHPDDLNHVKWTMWVEKVKETYEKLLRECSRVFVIGESMGALLAIELAAQHPEIEGLMLFAPATKVKNLWLARILKLFIHHLEKDKEDDGLPWQGYTVYPVAAAVQLLELQKHARKQLPKIEQPTWVFTGEFDETISPNSAEIIFDMINSESKQQIHMEESAHCILLDREQEEIFDYIYDFIGHQA